MSSEITVVGNITDDPQFRYLSDGTAVSRFTVASNERVRDENGQWRDGEPTFVPCTAWRGLAENAVESLRKGDRVVVTGRLRTNTWTTPDGQKRSRLELTAEEVGPSLRFATARPTKTATQAAAAAQTASQQAGRWPQPEAAAPAPSAATSGNPARVAAASFGTPAGSAAGVTAASGADTALGLVAAARAGAKDGVSRSPRRSR